mgnify:CR=1 FL=1
MNLIALDLDGTTLNSLSELTPKVIKAIQAADQWSDTRIVFCSGRPLSGVAPFAQRCGLSCDRYHILSNGAIIQSLSGDKLFEAALSAADYGTIKTYCDAEGLVPLAVAEDGVYTSAQLINPSGMNFCVLTNNDLIVRPVEDWPADLRLYKFLICEAAAVIKAKKASIIKQFEHDFACTQGYVDFLELSKKNTSKGSALSKLANYYNIASDNVYVVGDNENDQSAFQRFPHSIAMGNAVESLKELAYSVCPSNDEDGVAEALEQIRLMIEN